VCELGAIAGVPVAVKSAFSTTGTPTTWGTSLHTSSDHGCDAHTVQALRDSGTQLHLVTVLEHCAVACCCMRQEPTSQKAQTSIYERSGRMRLY
jgi:hypothetical protein